MTGTLDETASTKRTTLDTVRAVFVAIGLFVAGLVATFAFGIPAGVVVGARGGIEANRELFAVLSFVASSLGFGTAGLVYLSVWGGGVRLHAPSQRELEWIAGGTAVTTVVGLALSSAIGLLDSNPAETVFSVALGTTPALYLVLALVSLAFVGPGEELFFRGAIQGRLGRAVSSAAAVVGTTVLFMLIHVPNFLNGSLAVVAVGVGTIGVVSLVFGFAYERTGNVLVPMAIHGLYNASLFVVSYAGAVGVF